MTIGKTRPTPNVDLWEYLEECLQDDRIEIYKSENNSYNSQGEPLTEKEIERNTQLARDQLNADIQKLTDIYKIYVEAPKTFFEKYLKFCDETNFSSKGYVLLVALYKFYYDKCDEKKLPYKDRKEFCNTFKNKSNSSITTSDSSYREASRYLKQGLTLKIEDWNQIHSENKNVTSKKTQNIINAYRDIKSKWEENKTT